MAKKKLILIDGHSLAYRAFYGLPLYDQRGKVSFSTSQGEYTNAVYGFANTLIKTWNEEKPDYIAVAFDLGRTFRDDRYAGYKATRAKMPDELTPQIDRIVQLVEAFDIPAVTAESYEADDILGTLGKRAAADGLDVLIVTGDTDAFQLIDKRVRVLTSGRQFGDTSIYDEAAIKERYGLKPIQLIDFKALKGDTSDNVPGVKGIGEKTAQALLQKYGTLEGIYKNLAKVEPARAQTALEAGRDIAFLSKDLVTIRTDVPIKLKWDACAVQTYDRGKVEALFDILEFRSIRNRLPEGGTTVGATLAGRPAIAGKQMSMFAEETITDTATALKRPSVTQTIIVQDEAALQSLISKLQKAKIISFDTESTSTDPLRASLVGIALAVKEGEGYYIPVGHTQPINQLPIPLVIKSLKPLLENSNLPKVAHNAKYDMAMLRQVGIDVQGVAFDTMLAEFLIDPSARLGLKALAKSRLGIEMTEISELIGTGKKQITMAEVPIEEAAPYAAADVDMTLRLMKLQAPELKQLGVRKLFDEVEMPLLPVLLDMELAGVLIDTRLLKKMSDRLAKRLAQIEEEVYGLVGMPFNINSPNQLADALFGKLQLKAPGGRKTATGKVSVAADVLDSMRGMHPVIDLILEHRQLSKLKGTYLDALPALVHPATGRVHTSFNQAGAVSGRVASQDPNLQNIPIRTELGREVRQAFIVPDGWQLIAADYSQVELRIVAHICKDPGLRAAFASGQDIHRATAATVLGIPSEQVTPDQRRFAKCVAAGTLVATSNGLQPIEQIAGPMRVGGYRPIDLQVATDDHPQTATHVYYGGRQPVRRITAHGGFSLACTLRHRIRVIDAQGRYVWRFAEDLKVGDTVVVLSGAEVFGVEQTLPAVEYPADMGRTNFKDIQLPERWTPDLARFLGYLIAEGYLYQHPTRKYTSRVVMSQSVDEKDVVTDMAGVARVLFGDRVALTIKRGSQFITITSGKLVYWLQQIGAGGRSQDKTVPNCLLRAPRTLQVEFLRALFTGDGSLKNEGRVVTYSTKSFSLATRLQQMLLNLVFVFTLHQEHRREYPDPYYVLRLSPAREARRFVAEIGFISRRKQQIGQATHMDFTEIPNQLAYVREVYPMLTGTVREKAYEVLRPRLPVRFNHTRATMMVDQLKTRGVTHPAVKHFEELLRPGLRYLKVESIEEDVAEVYDLVVPGNHTYIANGFVSHNTVNFGLLYGMGAQSLAQQAGISMKEAQQFVDAYFAGFPNVKKYIDETKRKAKDEGYVETLLGRRRYFPILGTRTTDARTNIMQRTAEREAINHPVQGSAADILKIAMIRIHAALKQKKYRARLLLQVHDELLLEAPDAEVKAVTKLVKEIMEGAYPLDPPLKVEVGVGLNWDEVK